MEGVAFLALLVGFAAYTAPMLDRGASDIGALQLGTPDEHFIATGIAKMFTEQTLDYGIPQYPGFYPNLACLVLKPFVDGADLDEHALIIGLRLISFVFALLTICATALLAWLAAGRFSAALLTSMFMAFDPELIYWTVRIHPDSLLLFCLSLAQISLFLAVSKRSRRWLIAALVAAMLATMTKLVGLFLLPWIALAHLYIERPWHKWSSGLPALGVDYAKAAALIGVLAYVSMPRLLVASSGFIEGVQRQARLNAEGIGGSQGHPEWGWLSVLSSPKMIGVVALLGFVCWILASLPSLVKILRRRPSSLSADDEKSLSCCTILAFAAGYLAYLVVTTELYETRYAMPTLPTFAVAFGVLGGKLLPELWARFSPSPKSPWISSTAGAAVLVIAFGAAEGKDRASEIRGARAWVMSRDQDARLEVRQWLTETVPPDAALIYDYGVAVPTAFSRAQKTYGLLESQVKALKPRFILINERRRKMYLDPAKAEGNEKDQWYFRERCRTLKALEEGNLLGYTRFRRFPKAGITIYAAPKG